MNSALFNSVEELLPQAGDMILVSGVDSWGDDYVEVYVDQDGSSLFAGNGGKVPAWVGIEYMAQAISVYAGIRSKQNNSRIQLGFLLGTRKYTAFTPCFDKGCRLQVKVTRELFEEGGVSLFGCTIHSGGQLLAQAEIKAIQPDNIDDILEVAKGNG